MERNGVRPHFSIVIMATKKLFRHMFRFSGFMGSLKLAIAGIGYLFFYHRNMRIIFMMGIVAFLLGVYFG